MPTKLRLGLSLSSIRRVFGPGDEGNRILTQALENLVTQNGNSLFNKVKLLLVVFKLVTHLLLKTVILLLLTKTFFKLLVANHDAVADEEDVADELLDLLKSQAGEIIITQDNKHIALDTPCIKKLL